MNILLTGGTGFVGSHLAKSLEKDGHTVIVPYRDRDPGSYFFSQDFSNALILAQCDLKDEKRIFDVISKYEIDYILHLGAQAIVTTAYANPVETIETNVLGTTYILESARRYGKIKGIIVASSDKAYGKSAEAYTENSPLKGDHPYEVSKSACDLIAQSYAKTYNLPVSVVRFGNIYGPGDLNWNRIVPGIMKSVYKKEALELRSDGTFVRDYVYVNDVVSAYRFMLDHFSKVRGEAFNISSGVSMSVIDFLHVVESTLKITIKHVIRNTAINEIPYQHLDDAKIRALGWKSESTPEYALRETYAWYNAFFNKNTV